MRFVDLSTTQLDYLLKPIDKNDLRVALNKFQKLKVKEPLKWNDDKLEQVHELFRKKYKHRFIVRVGNQFKSFNVEDIAYFKSYEGMIYLHSHLGKSYHIEYTIDQLEDILNPLHFFRINRKFMVSVKAVQEIHTYFNSRLVLKLLPKEEEKVIVSRYRTANFKRWLDL